MVPEQPRAENDIPGWGDGNFLLEPGGFCGTVCSHIANVFADGFSAHGSPRKLLRVVTFLH
jgi:hypothetical protein